MVNMSTLKRKLWRDLFQVKTQALAIALVIVCGVASMVMSLSTARSLRTAQAEYYDDYLFADIFAHLKRAPNAIFPRIAQINGVAFVDTRVVADVTLDIEGMVEPAVGRLVSIPESSQSGLNRLHLRSGRIPMIGRANEVVVGEAFAKAHRVREGHKVNAILNGRLQKLEVVGVALSPEYVYSIRPGDLFPDDKRFGVFWINYRELASAFNMYGAFNDVSVRLSPGANPTAVLRRLDSLLAPYGCEGGYLRSDQTSHKLITDEFIQLRAMGLIPSAIFLAVAAIILNVVLSRLIATQREQIATLKAFGYYRQQIRAHYLQFAGLIISGGIAIGLIVGFYIGRSLTGLYTRFFRFPELHFQLHPGAVAAGIVLSTVTGMFAVWAAVRRATHMQPAEAMRPEPPARFRPTTLEKIGLHRRLTQISRIVLRNIERRPYRAVASTFGLSLALAIVVVGSFVSDIIDYVVELQFYRAQRFELNVAYVEPTSRGVLLELASLPGVLEDEPYRAVRAKLSRGALSRRLGILGFDENSSLHQLIDANGRVIGLPVSGLIISAKLAELLDVQIGESLQLDILEGKRPNITVLVSDVLRDVTGTSAYMRLSALNALLDEGPLISGTWLRTDSAGNPNLFRKLKETPRITSISSQRAAVRSFEDTMSANMLRMRLFNIAFAIIIAFGVVYNCARVALSERSRELATMRVLGFTKREVSGVLLGEIAILGLTSIPFGLLAGRGLAGLAIAGLETESQRFPLIISSATYAFAIVIVFAAAATSTLIVRRRIDRLDLLGALKAND
jgi:putative ABC transport system permease protein